MEAAMTDDLRRYLDLEAKLFEWQTPGGLQTGGILSRSTRA
jgi:hypothetical protein